MAKTIVKFTKRVSDNKSLEGRSGQSSNNKPFKCWGRNPSIPPADPYGKDETAFRSSFGEKSSWGIKSGTSSGEGRATYQWVLGGGCSPSITGTVDGEGLCVG